MPRRQRLRGVKICPNCGAGYDGFKAMELRGRYCSPVCLAAARAAPTPAISGGDATLLGQ